MKIFQWVGLATVLIVTAGVSSAVFAETETADEATKGFWVEEANIDLGLVSAGSDAVATYVFHNDTDKEVKIIKAKPS